MLERVYGVYVSEKVCVLRESVFYVCSLTHHNLLLLPLCSAQELLVGADSWSMSELVHAIVILAHYHSIAGFCLGCGVNPEIDTSMGHTYPGKRGDSATTHCFYSNPALGIGKRTPSDSESETSPTGQSPISPTNPNLARTIVEHYIDSECVFYTSTDIGGLAMQIS